MPLRFQPARGASVLISASSRGPTGAAATIAVGTTTTGAPGTDATVSNSGSSSAATFNFTIPRGDAGADGEVAGPVSSVIGNLASFGATDGNTIADSGYSPIDEDSFATDSATRLPTQQSVKAYVDGLFTALRNGVSASFDTLSEIATDLGLKMVKSANLSDVANTATAFSNIKQAASEIATGVVELATTAEATTATDTARAVTPAGIGAHSAPLAGGKTLTGGFKATPFAAGTKSSGTYTPLYSDGNFQTATNGGAHTLAPPADDCTIIIQYTNNGSAGAVTTSGFTKKTGDSIATTNGDDFFFFITKVGSFSHLHVQALQ